MRDNNKQNNMPLFAASSTTLAEYPSLVEVVLAPTTHSSQSALQPGQKSIILGRMQPEDR
jgi:hypothetical protein